MIDIHCHILHGIDDGAKNMNESIEMARIAYEDGIRHIIATPHFSPTHYNPRDLVSEKVMQLQKELDDRGIAIKLYPGNEVYMPNSAFIYEHTSNRSFHYLGETERFLLFEIHWSVYDPEGPEVVRWFVNKGVTPIIPHPERLAYVRQNPKILSDLIEAGAWTQVTVDSMLGKNNDEARKFAFGLLDQNLIHTIASDAHNTKRSPNVSEGFRIITERAGKARADEINERMNRIIEL